MKKLILAGISALVLIACACKTSEKSADAATHDLPLTNTHWVLTAINGAAVGEMPSEAFIVFDGKGKINGDLGCNLFFGTYYAKKGKMSIEYTGSTKRLCSDMKTEDSFAAALQSGIKSYTISGDVLTIQNENKEVLRFKAQN